MAQATHEVFNQFAELADYDLLATDAALQEALQRAGAAHALPTLGDYARRLGSAETYALAELANRHTPALHRFDSRGRRIDRVEFHPAWNALMALYRGEGLVSMPFDSDRPGRWATWAAGFYLHGQVEQGTLCPATMTQAAIPLLHKEPALWAQLEGRLHSRVHDPRDVPAHDKAGIWLGMGMTGKTGRVRRAREHHRGHADRRGRTRRRIPAARPQVVLLHTPERRAPGGGAHGRRWPLRLLLRAAPPGGRLAQRRARAAPEGQGGQPQQCQRRGGAGRRLGRAHGRGRPRHPTLIEMATTTRLNCVAGSAAILRQATVQAIAYARRRHAFGKALAEQPLMRAVLADLALESEAALALLMRLADAFERDDDGTASPADRAWKRVMTPAAKFWVCKRGVELAGEAMEVFGGNGYVQEGVMARLFLESPVNSIWEGSGNVMCLDVLRALSRDPEAAHALLEELTPAAQGEPRIAAALRELQALLAEPPEALEAMGRLLVQRLVLLPRPACCAGTRPRPWPMRSSPRGWRPGAWGAPGAS